MYDMKILEQEWKNYRKNKVKPYFIIGTVIVMASIFLFVFLHNKIDFERFGNPVKNFSNSIVKINSKNDITTSHVMLNKALKRLEIDKKVLHLDNIAQPVQHDTPDDILVDIPILDKEVQKSNGNHIQVERKNLHLNIIETASVSAYKDVEKRFYQSPDVDDALFLAKSYYKKENYEKSEYWALETNKIDENIEESLLIFVKSKIKLGRKNEAIGILMSYINKSGSKEAKDLLYQINNDQL